MESITKPVIGIVFCGFSDDRLFVPFSYIQAIEKSDGIPVIIPYLSDADSLSSYLSICDGFLFCGGDDITPELFGEELQTDHGTTDRKTDQFHLTLMQKVLDFHLPVLGICRGMQVLNLALGGTIYQDLSLRNGTPSIISNVLSTAAIPAIRLLSHLIACYMKFVEIPVLSTAITISVSKH